MASWGGHTLPGTFFILFGLFYSFKYPWLYLKRDRKRTSRKNGGFYCCNGHIPCSGIVIEGIVKICFVSIGILVELFYPGAPMGHLHEANGQLTHPMNWQHATMYFFFGLSGVADVISYTARHIIPPGIDRLFGGVALFVEGYLFVFHLHGRSLFDTRVHILLVLAVWPGALIASVQCLVMHKRKILHIFEMLTATLLIAQGTWFWQAAYALYPPDGNYWDPCFIAEHLENDTHSQSSGEHDALDCNDTNEAMVNLMFITMFWSWHIAASLCVVGLIYFLVYKILKYKGSLDPSFEMKYEQMSNGGSKINSATPLNGGLLSDEEEEDEI